MEDFGTKMINESLKSMRLSGEQRACQFRLPLLIHTLILARFHRPEEVPILASAGGPS